MTSAPGQHPVGYRKCTNPACIAMVHYRHVTCKTCMAKQQRERQDMEPQVRRDASGIEITVAANQGPAAGAQQPAAESRPPLPAAAPDQTLHPSAQPPAPPVALVPPLASSETPVSTSDGGKVSTPEPEAAYLVMADFNGQVGNVLCVMRKGMVVTDPNLIASLLEQGAPLVPTSEAAGMVCCPTCKTLFQPAKVVATGSQRRAG